MRIDRMLAIVVILLNKKRVSAKDLADKFEVSIRTVYRDIEAINLAGIPIVSYSGNNGGFGIMDTFKLDRQLFTIKDMLSVLSALQGMNAALGDRELASAIEKISSLVPKERSEEIKLHMEQIVIDIMPWGVSNKIKGYIKILYEAIGNCQIMNIVYQNSKGELASRDIEPMTLLFKGYSWYLFAFCLLKNDYRFFRLSRIKNMQLLDRYFKRRESSYQKHTTFDINKIQQVKTTTLVLKFSPQAKQQVEDYFDDALITTDENDNIIVKVSMPEDEWVYSYIMSFGEYVEVLSPAHIRKIISQKAEKISRIYIDLLQEAR